MEVRLATWKIKTLNQRRSKINPKPQYQRTSVWSIAKKKLFIDSILRGYDVPKFYLRETPMDSIYDYEVTDGQQRMRAICEFMSSGDAEKYFLDKAIINEVNVEGMQYSSLGDFKEKFDNYELNIALIDEASPEEIRSLFARLQMGEQLNKVELRHAMSSNIGAAIISVSENHPFFKTSRIPTRRFKHQDYLDHVITFAYYNGSNDVKAKNIEEMYKELADSTSVIFTPYISKANKVLDWMNLINNISKGIFKNKWAFFDTFWMFYKNFENIDSIDYQLFCNRFKAFEGKRLENNRNPERLISDPVSSIYDKNMYEYIMAFKYSGNTKNNLKKRNEVFEKYFLDNSVTLKIS